MRRRLQACLALVGLLLACVSCGNAKKRPVIVPPKCVQEIRWLGACELVEADKCDVKVRVRFACVEYPNGKESK